MRTPILTLCITLSAACAAEDPSSIQLREGALIYGDDDRAEVYELHGDNALSAAARSVAAIIPRRRLSMRDDGTLALDAPTLGAREQLCPDERFVDQPSAAECSAALVGSRLLVTAGHCFSGTFDCTNALFVFDYAYAAEGEFSVDADDVYTCRRVVVQRHDAPSGRLVHDYAVIELTRAVEGRTPFALRSQALVAGERLSVLSTPGGVPVKVDVGARVVAPRSGYGDYFTLDSDTFYGSSGGPVLDERGALVGLLARGGEDYAYDAEGHCQRVTHAESPAPGSGRDGPVESASYVRAALTDLCAGRYPNERLCGFSGKCGDGVCSRGEDTACESDCPAPEPVWPNALSVAPSVNESDSNEQGAAPPPVRGSTGCALGHGASHPPVLPALLLIAWAYAQRRGRRPSR